MSTGKTAQVTTPPPANWSNYLEQLIREYETQPAKGLAHGLQKDAIQNGWGARDGNKRFRFEITLLKNAKPKPLLVLADRGTVGLTGQVLEPKDLPAQIPPQERLARFEAIFESGGQEGPGLFGRGKLLFNAASKDNFIFYDTLTKDGEYRFNIRGIDGRQYHHFPKVLEGDQAKREVQVRSKGALSPLDEPGTRIVILNPKTEIVEAIESGALLSAVEETWWEIIQKYKAEITVRVDGGAEKLASVPADFGSLPKESQKGWKVHLAENIPVQIDKRQYRIKRVHLIVPPPRHPVREDLRGVAVHRKGMKVGDVRLSVVPKEIEDRFFGYVELDTEYEELISGLENTTHYGFASLHKAPNRVLRQHVQDHFDQFLERLGLKKKGEDPEERMRRALEDAEAELNSILRELGVPSFGSGREPKSDFLVSVEDLAFPGNSNYVSTGDRIGGFWFRVRNLTDSQRSIWLEVYTYERDVDVIETLQPRQRLDIAAGDEHKTAPFLINLVSTLYPSRKKIACVCRLTDSERKEIARKAFYFYLDLEQQKEPQLANIRLISVTWPRTQSRRVDYGEEVSKLQYEIENLTGIQMKAKVRLRTLWAAEGNTPIDDVGVWDIELSPFQSLELQVEKVVVTETRYQEIGRGQINLRCHAVAIETSPQWTKGLKLAENTIGFFLNMDPYLGFFEDQEYFDGGPHAARSEAQSLGQRSWKLRINKTHPAYIAAQDDTERVKNYLFELMAAQIAYVLVRADDVKVLQKQLELGDISTFGDLSLEDVLQRVAYRFTDRILASYYGG